jgi:fructokinase
VILVGGEALVDLVDERGTLRVVAGGGPFNTAVALGRLAVDVAFLGTLSRDSYGEMLASRLAEVGVDTSLVRRSDAATPKAVVHRRADDRNEYTFELDATAFSDFPVSGLPPLPDDAWALHLGTLALGVDPPAAAFEALIDREAGDRSIILDPNVRPLIFGDVEVYRGRFERLAGLADIVKLSDDDAAWLYPALTVDRVLEYILGLGPRLVAITLGREGAMAGTGEVRVRTPGMAIDVVDTVGAGDSFGAAFVAALLDGGVLGPGRIDHVHADRRRSADAVGDRRVARESRGRPHAARGRSRNRCSVSGRLQPPLRMGDERLPQEALICSPVGYPVKYMYSTTASMTTDRSASPPTPSQERSIPAKRDGAAPAGATSPQSGHLPSV